jgi:general secretion pathway protein F
MTMDRSDFWRQLAALSRMGVALPDALEWMRRSRPPARPDRCGSIAASLRRGASLAEAVRLQGGRPEAVASLQASEASGDLAAGLDDLAARLERDETRSASWRSALAYPRMLSAALAGVALFAAAALQPLLQMEHLERAPWLLRLAYGVEALIWTPQAGLVILLGAALAHLVLSGFDPLRLRLPFVGDGLRRLEAAAWLHWLDPLVARGIPLPDAVRAAAQGCATTPFRAALGRVADRVESGTRLSAALAAEPLVPSLATALVAHGEATEYRGGLLRRAAAVLERGVEAGVRSALPLAERLAVVLVGSGVALVALVFFLQIDWTWRYL